MGESLLPDLAWFVCENYDITPKQKFTFFSACSSKGHLAVIMQIININIFKTPILWNNNNNYCSQHKQGGKKAFNNTNKQETKWKQPNSSPSAKSASFSPCVTPTL